MTGRDFRSRRRAARRARALRHPRHVTQWFKAVVGLDLTETPRAISFCSHAIEGEGPFIVEDASGDERFANNPLVTGALSLRFFAGVPLVEEHDGLALGTLCVLDTRPRGLTELQLRTLRVLSKQVVAQLEVRKLLAREKSLHDSDAVDEGPVRRTEVEDAKAITVELDGRVTPGYRGVGEPDLARRALADQDARRRFIVEAERARCCKNVVTSSSPSDMAQMVASIGAMRARASMRTAVRPVATGRRSSFERAGAAPAITQSCFGRRCARRRVHRSDESVVRRIRVGRRGGELQRQRHRERLEHGRRARHRRRRCGHRIDRRLGQRDALHHERAPRLVPRSLLPWRPRALSESTVSDA